MKGQVIAVTSFMAEIDGEVRHVRPGERFPADHKFVKRSPELFEPAIEQPTAAPGERRRR